MACGTAINRTSTLKPSEHAHSGALLVAPQRFADLTARRLSASPTTSDQVGLERTPTSFANRFAWQGNQPTGDGRSEAQSLTAAKILLPCGRAVHGHIARSKSACDFSALGRSTTYVRCASSVVTALHHGVTDGVTSLIAQLLPFLGAEFEGWLD